LNLKEERLKIIIANILVFSIYITYGKCIG
jgi:hypothetical protein